MRTRKLVALFSATQALISGSLSSLGLFFFLDGPSRSYDSLRKTKSEPDTSSQLFISRNKGCEETQA